MLTDRLNKKALLLAVPVGIFILLCCFSGKMSAVAQEAGIYTGGASGVSDGSSSAKNSSTAEEADAQKSKVELEQEEAETIETIEKKEQEALAAKKETEKIIEEKEVLKESLEAKEEAATLLKEKAATIKKEASATNDKKALNKAKELSRQAEQLEREATIQKEKLKIAEEKALLAQKQLNLQEENITELKKELRNLKTEKLGKMSFVEKALRSVVIIILGVILFLLLKKGLKVFERLITEKDRIRESEATLRIKTLVKLFYWMGSLIIMGAILYMVLENHGFNVAPLLAGAGIVGLAFGFGGQYLIRDLINGLFILIEGQYRINDVVKINEYGGLVEDINLRITTLRDLAGRVIIIPNGEVKTVVNFTREYAQALLDIGVAYKENVDKVMDVIKAIGKEMQEDAYFGRLILGELEMLGVDDFGDSQVTIKFRIKTLPIKQWEVSREFRRRLKNRFDELGIEIPFPHRTLYWGIGKDNDWMKALLNQHISKAPKGEK